MTSPKPQWPFKKYLIFVAATLAQLCAPAADISPHLIPTAENKVVTFAP